MNYLHVQRVWKFTRAQKYYSPCEKYAEILLAWYRVFRFKKCKINIRRRMLSDGIRWSSDGQTLGEKGIEYEGTSVRYKY